MASTCMVLYFCPAFHRVLARSPDAQVAARRNQNALAACKTLGRSFAPVLTRKRKMSQAKMKIFSLFERSRNASPRRWRWRYECPAETAADGAPAAHAPAPAPSREARADARARGVGRRGRAIDAQRREPEAKSQRPPCVASCRTRSAAAGSRRSGSYSRR